MEESSIFPALGAGSIFESQAEKAVYEKLDRELKGESRALYSLWIRKTASAKKHAEIDFLVATRKAFILLEVKGGEFWRDAAGLWHFRPRHGGTENTKREGPFDQARVALHAVESHLKRHDRPELFYNYVWGYGVIAPDCALEIPGTDIGCSSDLLLDSRRFDEPIDDFISRLSDYWERDCIRRKEKLGRSPSELAGSIGKPKRDEVLNLLRPQIRLIESTGMDMRDAMRRSDALTDQQALVLDIARHNKRILLSGGAGTGKTLLAMEQARRRCLQGDRVLFTCFNRNLADSLSRTVGDSSGDGCLTVMNWHRIVRGLVDAAGSKSHVPKSWDEFNEVAFDLVVDAIGEIEDFTPYDYLVVDEGQDLMSESFVDVLELLLDGGIENGRWMVCYDPQQAIYDANYEELVLTRLDDLGVSLNLSRNCRNTRNIAAHVSGLTATDPGILIDVRGPDVEIEYHETRTELLKQLKSVVNRGVRELQDAGFDASDMVILSPRRDIVASLALNEGVFIRGIQKYSTNLDSSKICWSTVHGFKGLEAPEIVIVGFDSIKSDRERLQLYVGGSRARSKLTFCLPESAADEVQVALPRILKMLDS